MYKTGAGDRFKAYAPLFSVPQPGYQLRISAISCWELAKLVEKGRIGFSIPTLAWMQRSMQEYHIGLLDLTPEIAVESTLIRGIHADPADQIIAATSRIMGMPLVTSDKRLRQLQSVETIW